MKTCFRCGENKELDSFYRHPKMADGHLNKCKICTRNDAIKHRNENIEKIRAYDRIRGGQINRKNTFKIKTQRLRAKIPGFESAHSAVSRAIKRGDLIRPAICSRCPATERMDAIQKAGLLANDAQIYDVYKRKEYAARNEVAHLYFLLYT